MEMEIFEIKTERERFDLRKKFHSEQKLHCIRRALTKIRTPNILF
jgi:hypothetical protein